MSEMKRVLTAKFKDPTLRHKLLQAPSPITMDNPYHDTYWGLYNGRGQNRLGKLLEEVRDDIRREMGIIIRKETSVVSYKIQQGGLVAFDTETTGLSSKYNDILQITIVGQDGAVLLDTYVKPQNCTHWEESQAVHGISPEDVAHAPSAERVSEIVKRIFDHADKIIGYNVGFDTKMVTARFGYDFTAKEMRYREKHPDEWTRQVEEYKDVALLDRDRYKQAVEEMLLIRETFGTSIIIVTHNIGVIGAMADNVLVMKDGEMVEYGPTRRVLDAPEQPYTRKLMAAVPRLSR